MTNLFGNCKKALVIGAGSGRDMASSVLITERLRKEGIVVDLAGFLTPWAVHTFDNKLEKPVNVLVKNSKKFLANNLDKPLSTYFEPTLLSLNKEIDSGIRNFYVFSLHYGTEKLGKAINSLVKKNKYDLIIAVDVGGDCLAQKEDYKSIFTPLVDFSCIKILANLNFNGKIILSVISPGTDGEISTNRITRIISDLAKKNILLRQEKINPEEESTKKFLRLNHKINEETSSKSGTFKFIEKYLKIEDKGLKNEEYVKNYFANNKYYEYKFNHLINPELVKSIFYFDLKKFHKSNKINISYESIIDAQKKYRKIYAGTEVDLSYIPIIRGSKISRVIYSLTPNIRIEEKIRRSMIIEGHNPHDKEKVDSVLVLKEDLHYLSNKDKKIKII